MQVHGHLYIFGPEFTQLYYYNIAIHLVHGCELLLRSGCQRKSAYKAIQ